jgi:hypothetical protein
VGTEAIRGGIMAEWKSIQIDPEIAMLIDWLLTMHSFDQVLMEMLQGDDYWDIRKQIGQIILSSGKEKKLYLSPMMLKHLILIAPITFRFFKRDVGQELKRKLYEVYAGKPIEIEWLPEKPEEQTNEPTENDNNTNPSEDNSQDPPSDSPDSRPEPVSS